jgi:hypothetical protein
MTPIAANQAAAGAPARPSVARWVGYAYGAGLPARNRAWVLFDTTSHTWALRHVTRSLLQLAPLVAVVLLAVPGPFWIRAMSAGGGVAMGQIYSLGYMVETTEHRLVKAGYPVGTGERVREQAATAARASGTAQRRAKMMARMDRRLS